MPKVNQGVECLRNYRREYDEKRNIFYDKPWHDWSSHGADSARYFAVGVFDISSWSKPIKVNTGWVV